jgi:signal transduction histidine kinase
MNWWKSSVRIRIAVTTFMVVAITLSAGSAALVWQLRRAQQHDLVTAATAEADAVAGLLTQESPPRTLTAGRQGYAVQVVNGAGQVIAATPEVAHHRAVSTDRPAVGQNAVLSIAGSYIGVDDPAVTIATSVRERGGIDTIYVLTSTEQAENAVHDLALSLIVALPFLALLSGLLGWVLAGRALRPVEAVRAEVAEFSGRNLARRLPSPANDDEVSRLVRTMNDLLSRIESGADRQRQFVSDASHELRSPLAALIAQVEVARAHPDDANWTSVADAVLEDGTRLWHLVDDLLLLARSDEGELPLRAEAVDLDEMVLKQGRRLRERGKVTVVLSGVGAARAWGDTEQLHRLVRNLSDNAERHAQECVAFELHQKDGWIALVVADDGPGIPPEERARVFERFARIDESRHRPDGGTGLGLAIVAEIVSAHGGRIDIEDVSEGTRMVVHLPAAITVTSNPVVALREP